eukprot:58601-Prorocentrum_lima.AAC.1
MDKSGYTICVADFIDIDVAARAHHVGFPTWNEHYWQRRLCHYCRRIPSPVDMGRYGQRDRHSL